MPLYRAFTEANVAGLAADLALKAAIDSQAFTGTPSLPTGTTATTQATGDNSTKLATTAYVVKEVESLSPAIYTYCGGL